MCEIEHYRVEITDTLGVESHRRRSSTISKTVTLHKLPQRSLGQKNTPFFKFSRYLKKTRNWVSTVKCILLDMNIM